jgi:hypothetical protein
MECSICLDEIEDSSDYIKLQCSHYFHSNCINQWLSKSNLCPYCRNIIKDTYQIYFSKYKVAFLLAKLQEMQIVKKTLFIKNDNMKIPINRIKTIYFKNYIIELKVLVNNKIVSRFIKGSNKVESYDIFEHLRRIMVREVE